MKSSRILSCILILLITLVLTPQAMFAAPSAQSGTGEAIQIVLVLDSSGSMGIPVYTEIVPEDLLSLLLRMDEIRNDPIFINLTDQVEEAENDSAVSQAKEAWQDAFEELSDWLTANQGISLSGNQAIIRTALKSAGCDDTSDQSISCLRLQQFRSAKQCGITPAWRILLTVRTMNQISLQAREVLPVTSRLYLKKIGNCS